jgi:hypothetical protein
MTVGHKSDPCSFNAASRSAAADTLAGALLLMVFSPEFAQMM